jgi:hypothetical protein
VELERGLRRRAVLVAFSCAVVPSGVATIVASAVFLTVLLGLAAFLAVVFGAVFTAARVVSFTSVAAVLVLAAVLRAAVLVAGLVLTSAVFLP